MKKDREYFRKEPACLDTAIRIIFSYHTIVLVQKEEWKIYSIWQ